MNIRTVIVSVLLLLGVVVVLIACTGGNVPTLQLTASGIGNNPSDGGDITPLQDDQPDEEEPDEEEPDEEEPSDEEPGEEEPDEEEPSDEEPEEEEPEEEAPDTATPGMPAGDMTDVMAQPGTEIDQDLQDALMGYRDYEVSYDADLTRRELTPPELLALGVEYAGEESEVAQITQALKTLNLEDTLRDRYTVVEESFATSPDDVFFPDNPDRDQNYLQPRDNPFFITDLIPDELRPELEGTGLDGAVDPELLARLRGAEYEANLRYIPIAIVGVMETGPYRGCLYTFAGYGGSWFLREGDDRCHWYGSWFSLTAVQISEDYVVLSLRGTTPGCRFAITGPVARTFHVTSY